MSICSSAARAVSWTLSHLPWRADHIRDINKRMFKSGAPWLFNSDTPVSWWMSFLKCPFLYYLIMCMNIFFWVCVWLFSLWICTCECSTGRLHKRELDPLELYLTGNCVLGLLFKSHLSSSWRNNYLNGIQ